MPHIVEPGGKLRRLCALFRELCYVSSLSLSLSLTLSPPPTPPNSYVHLKRDLYPYHVHLVLTSLKHVSLCVNNVTLFFFLTLYIL